VDSLSDVAQLTVDACTLNNALNIAQLAVLIALLRWVRSDVSNSRSANPSRGEDGPL